MDVLFVFVYKLQLLDVRWMAVYDVMTEYG